MITKEKILKRVKSCEEVIFKFIFYLSIVSVIMIVPIRIVFGCNAIDFVIITVYSFSGFILYFIGMNHIKRFKEENNLQEEQIKKLYEASIKDSLTEIYNRSFIFEKLGEVSRNLSNRDIPVSIIIFDVDLFKEVNDNYGHLVGDSYLKKIAKTVEANIRSSDILGRYGGEEFLIIAPNTDIRKAEYLAENIRKKVEESTKGEVTISLGLTEIINENDIDFAIKRADDAMYLSKNLGRNRVTVG